MEKEQWTQIKLERVCPELTLSAEVCSRHGGGAGGGLQYKQLDFLTFPELASGA